MAKKTNKIENIIRHIYAVILVGLLLFIPTAITTYGWVLFVLHKMTLGAALLTTIANVLTSGLLALIITGDE